MKAIKHTMYVDESAQPVSIAYSNVSIQDSDEYPDGNYELEFEGQKVLRKHIEVICAHSGLAAVSHPEQTIFVRFGYVRPFSDIAGLHYVSMDGSAEQRQELALRLKSAGCPVNLDEEHWLHAGDFAPPESGSAGEQHASGALKNEITAYVSSLDMEWEAQKRHRPILLGPLWKIVDRACQKILELHTKAAAQGAHETAAKLAEGYQALKKYEGAESTATLDFDDFTFITEVDDAIARLKSAA